MHEHVCCYIMFSLVSENGGKTTIPTMKRVSKIGNLFPFSG